MTTAHPELLFDKGPGTTVEVKGEIRQSLEKNIYKLYNIIKDPNKIEI